MKVNEIFESIQGEGLYAGHPVLFIRISGCNKSCDFCDSKYHTEGKIMSIYQIAKKIDESNKKIVVWTGGEPSLQIDDIYAVINLTQNKTHHLETNGSGVVNYKYFQYVCCSPKEQKDIRNFLSNAIASHCCLYDIKVVTDLLLNKNMIKYATMLMPLTSVAPIKTNEIKKNVWKYCEKNNIRYCLRQHIEVWGKARGV